MKFLDFYILFTFYLFTFYLVQVRSDSITEFGKTVNEAINKSLNYEEEFADSVIQMLSNLKDLSMEVNSNALQATLDQANFVNEKAKIDQTVCIASAKDKFGEKIVNLSFGLDACVHVPKTIGDPIREKFQKIHEEILKMEEDLKEVKTSCSSKTEKSEECVSEKITKAQKDLNNLLEEARMNNIAGETLKSKILSESLKCSATVSADMFQFANEFQDIFTKCIA